MRFAQLGSLAALAGLSQAFLVPPTISDENYKLVEIPYETQVHRDQTLEINCPGCPIAGSEGILRHAENHLRFNLSTVSVEKEADSLMINGFQIFPINTQATSKSLTADQLVKKPDGTWGYSSSPELGYSMSIKPAANSNQDELYDIRLRIIEVGATFVRGIPAINMKVIRTSSGRLFIQSSQVGPTVAGIVEPQCPSLLCHWKAAIANKVNALKKGCGSKKGGPPRGPRPHHGRPHHGPEGGHRRPHPHHHSRPQHNSFGRFLQGFVLHVIMPIMIGVALGITASLVGMVVGHIAIFFWRLFFRRGERGQYCRVKQEEVVEETDEEAKAFLENQGPPPVYDESVIVDDEKTEQV